MPTTSLTDDQLDDAIAEEIARRVCACHPTATSRMRRGLVKLYVEQAAGVASSPGRISDRELAAYFGEAPQRISETRNSALARAWRAIHEKYPELL